MNEEQTSIYIDGKKIGTCLRVKSSQDNRGLRADYSYHIEGFVPINEESEKLTKEDAE